MIWTELGYQMKKRWTGPEPGASGLEKTAPSVELEFFSRSNQNKTKDWALVHERELSVF